MTIAEIITTGPTGFKTLNLDHSENYECHHADEICKAATAAGLWVDRCYDDDGIKNTLIILSTKEREPNGD